MSPEPMSQLILNVVKTYCRPEVVGDLMKGIRRSEALDRSLHRGKGFPTAGQRGRALSLSDQEKLDRLITVCNSRLSVDDLCEVLLGIGDIFKAHGETGRAEEMYTLALSKGEESGKRGYVAEAYMRRGEVYSRRAQWKQSNLDLGRSRAIFTELKLHDALGRVENILGTNHAEQGQLAQAAGFFERALVLFERTQQTQMAGVALMNLGIIRTIAGDPDSALVRYKRAQACFEEVGNLHRLAELHHNMGMSYLAKNLLKEASGEFTASYSLSLSTQSVPLMGLAELARAYVSIRQHDLPVALKQVNHAIDLFTKSNDRLGLADAYKVKGMIHRELKSLDAAASFLETSLRINSELNNHLNIAETCFEIGLLQLKRNRRSDALQAFLRAKAAFKRVGAHEDLKKTQAQINVLQGEAE